MWPQPFREDWRYVYALFRVGRGRSYLRTKKSMVSFKWEKYTVSWWKTNYTIHYIGVLVLGRIDHHYEFQKRKILRGLTTSTSSSTPNSSLCVSICLFWNNHKSISPRRKGRTACKQSKKLKNEVIKLFKIQIDQQNTYFTGGSPFASPPSCGLTHTHNGSNGFSSSFTSSSWSLSESSPSQSPELRWGNR